MIEFIRAALATAVLSIFLVPVGFFLLRLFGIFTTVSEGRCHVYVIFGRVIGVLGEPGFYFLPAKLGAWAFIVNFFGRRVVLDMRMDQEYLRSQPVNSEEGAPMGIGIWY
jgi:regulator of protease activity HflC (stomatin/prohibitin superfamily)